jgi:hypothetical protein
MLMGKKGRSNGPAAVSLSSFLVLLLMTMVATLHFGTLTAQATQAALTWSAPTTYPDGSPITDLSGYKIYTGTSPGNYSQNINVGNLTSYDLTGLSDATSYYFAVTAYDSYGVESELSSAFGFTTPAAPPPAALYTLAASAGNGGSITPSGSIALSSGLNQTFAITPNSGYQIAALTVDGASVGAPSSYTFSNVVASHTIAASFIPASSSVTPSAPSATPSGPSVPPSSTGSAPFAVNCGGSPYASSTGDTYLADSNFTGGSVDTATGVITGTPDGTLYQSERYGNFSYSIPVANGNYAVTLKFAETYFAAAGKRIFSVTINGQTVVSNLDLYATAGKNAAYDVVVPVSVTTGAININFVSQVNYAKVSAIKVAPAAGSVVFADHCGGPQYLNSAGISYQADCLFSGGSFDATTAAISGTADGALYQSERYGNFSYNIPVANGNYAVTLKFAETYFTAAGKRIFSVNINGQTVISNLDLYAKVGKNAAYDVVIPVTVTGGTLGVNFLSQVNYAKVSAILVQTR